MSDLRLLRNFVEVYRARSFRAAAEAMGVAQSSVSKRIALLETQLDMRLFNRTTRAVEPTDSARALFSHAEAALISADVFTEEARLLADGELGAIRVGAIALAAETLVVEALAALVISHPGLEVEVVVGGSDVYRDLARGRCDLVVGEEANLAMSAHAGVLRSQPVCNEQLVFVHRPDHPAKEAAQLSDLLRHALAVPSRYFNENRLFATLARRTDPVTFPRYRLNSLSACLSLAASSDVVTLAPRTAVPPGLVIADFATGINMEMVLVTLARHSPTPAVRAFSEALVR